VLHVGVEDGVPIGAGLLVVGSDCFDLELTQRVANRSSPRTNAAMIRGRVADLGRLGVAWVGRRSVDLGCGGANGVGRATNASRTSTGAGRRRALRWLRAHAVSYGALRIALLVLWLLRSVGVRRGTRESRWPLGHLMLRAHLLLLGRGVLLRRDKTSCLVAAGHDAAKEAVAGRD
jgi:hypothetical protein